jgi:PPOX class probable F420-dependent enzyme
VETSEALDFVRQHHRGVLATTRADGQPQLSPVTGAVDEQGRIIVSSRETAYKVRNLRRTPRAWLCVLPDGFFGRWIQVAGRVDLLGLPEAMDGLVDYYRRTSGEHPDWADYRASMIRERRVLIRLGIEEAGPDRMG